MRARKCNSREYSRVKFIWRKYNIEVITFSIPAYENGFLSFRLASEKAARRRLVVVGIVIQVASTSPFI